jgi:hypothetical protein
MVMTALMLVLLVLVWLELMFLLGLRIHLSRVFFFQIPQVGVLARILSMN